MAFGVLYSSYLTSVMADQSLDAGKAGEAAILDIMSMIPLPIAIFSVAIAVWIVAFKVPTEKVANWMKKENV
jgi:hypothetical protein